MLRLPIILLVFSLYYFTETARIESPSNELIEKRLRKDLDSIDSIFRYYITPHEIQFHVDAIKDDLPFFLRCIGSTNPLQFTVPESATEHLSFDPDFATNTITIKLRRKTLSLDLVGRYTCSEIINNRDDQTSVHVFIQNGKSVFTKRSYPAVLKQTGIHFFNIPCQTVSWFPRMSCSDSNQCQRRSCNPRERQENELKCNTPVCNGQDPCIPVYYTPSNLKPEKVFFDPQIGFALENPTISNSFTQFVCMSNYTPSHQSIVPYDSSEAEYVQIHQPSLTVMSDETVRLTCEIQYGTKVDRKMPSLFWFEDIYNLNLISNQTEKPAFNLQTQIYSRNSSITLRGFKANKVYRFYCARVSEQGIYSRSVDITCADAPTLDVEVNSRETDTDDKILYGSDGVYDITILTIPRSSILIELSRNGVPLTNNKRFELSMTNNQENQFWEYSLTIYNVTFEDETDLKIHVKSSALEKTIVVKPNIIGNPVGQLEFSLEQTPSAVAWRDENHKNKRTIYPYGIFERETYRAVCTIRHRSDIQQPLKIFLQYFPCSIDNCLSNLIDRTCQYSSNENVLSTTTNRINDFQTQFVSSTTHLLDDPSMGYQYLCCYEQNGLINIAKAMTVLSNHRQMFHISKPEFSLVTGDTLTYRCEGHEALYDDLRMLYNDGVVTFERNRYDPEWRQKDTNQVKQVDIEWMVPNSENIRSTTIEVKTPTLRMIGDNGYVQCIGLSKRLDFLANANDTYRITVDDPVPLQFKNSLESVSTINGKTGDTVVLDCQYDGRPTPKLVWLKGKAPLTIDDSILHFADHNASITIIRTQASDTGYYTCELNNGRDPLLRRSFDLRIKGTNPYAKFSRFTAVIVIFSVLILLIMLILLIVFAVKYRRMKKNEQDSLFYGHKSIGPEDKSQPAMSQLARIPLPADFATVPQIRTFLSYVNGDTLPAVKDDFKELGRGQFGVVYQVRLPDVDLVAAKILPETIRTTKTEHRRDKRNKSVDIEENEQMITKQELQKKKAAEMLIDEIKVMYKAGKHVNIVALKKVAYPQSSVKLLFSGGTIRDEDSFYLMELCSNGSLESVLKQFNQSNPSQDKPSLYQTLSTQAEPDMTVAQACEDCLLTDDDLKLAAYQVACAVDYLNRRQIAHCDIAPRNVLVTSRFIMKICDFGLATWTTYKNYREQLAEHHSVQLEKKNNDIATHNLTPELANIFLQASNFDEQTLLNKSTIKSDVWSFGIFLWTLFLRCRIRPFEKLLKERENARDTESFFHQLARIISEGRVRRYIDYQAEIPRNIYAIVNECLVEETHRPEMTRIRALLCHSKMLSKQAFEYYRSEYNRYQEENTIDGNVERFGEEQGVSVLPTFDEKNSTVDETTFPTSTVVDYAQQERDSYLKPSDDNQQSDTSDAKSRKPLRPPPPLPPPKSDTQGDSYL